MKISKKQITKIIMILSLLGPLVAIAYPDLVTASLQSRSETTETKQVFIFDGKHKRTITTGASELEEVLAESDIMLRPHDKVWMSTKLIENGTVIGIERFTPVFLVEGGKTKLVYTTEQTVQGVLNESGFDWRKFMPLEEEMTKVTEGMQIHVVPYTVRTVTREESMPVSYVKWYDSSLGADEQMVIENGRAGKKRSTIEEYVSGGEVIRRKELASDILEKGISGVAKTGNQEGTVGWVTVMHATAYHPSDGSGECITAIGTPAKRGVVAVDPSFIPLGTHVYIPGYGEAVAEDTGGAIVGNCIDLCMETFEECYDFGRRNIEVFVKY